MSDFKMDARWFLARGWKGVLIVLAVLGLIFFAFNAGMQFIGDGKTIYLLGREMNIPAGRYRIVFESRWLAPVLFLTFLIVMNRVVAFIWISKVTSEARGKIILDIFVYSGEALSILAMKFSGGLLSPLCLYFFGHIVALSSVVSRKTLANHIAFISVLFLFVGASEYTGLIPHTDITSPAVNLYKNPAYFYLITTSVIGYMIYIGLGSWNIFRKFSEYKKADEALRENEEKLRLAFENSKDAIYWADSETGILVNCNKSAERLVERSREEIIGKHHTILHPQESIEDYGRMFREHVAHSSAQENEAVVVTKSGKLVPVLISSTVVMIAGKKINQGIFIDITELKKMENALAEKEERLSLVMDGSQLGYWDWDIVTGKVNRNSHWAEMLGYSLEEINSTNKQWTDLHHPDDREAAWKSIQDHLDGRTPIHRIEYRMLAKNGEYRWILDQAKVVTRDEQGKPLRMSGTHSDITENKRVEEALRESEKKYRHLHETMSDAFVQVDMAGRIREFNHAYQEMLGYDNAELSRLTYVDLTPSKWHGIEERILRDEILKHGYSEIYEKEYVRKNGEVFPIEVRTFLLRDEAGAPSGMWAIVRDITERKLIESAQLFMLHCGSATPGEDFFQSLARYLAENLCMDFVCIDRLLGDGLFARTEAIYFDGKFDDNVTYALKDTPCGDVVGKTICCFPRNVRGLFPGDEVLQQMVADSYLGTTLWSSSGKPVGLIAVIGRKPMANPKLAESILKLASIRAAGELERKLAEEALRESEALLAKAQDIAGIGSWEWDMKTEKIKWSHKMFELFGVDPLTFDGTYAKAFQNIHPEDLPGVEEATRRALELSKVLPIEFRVLTPGGGERVVYSDAEIVKDEKGNALRMLGFYQDITARKQADQEKEFLRQQLLQSQKMEAIGTMAGGLAHDFNNMLTVVLANAQLTRMGIPPDSKLSLSMSQIENAACRAKDLTMKLLTFARKEKVHVQNADINRVTENVIGFLERTIPKNIEIKNMPGGNIPTVSMDVNQIHQVLLNICNNACGAMPGGGILALETSRIFIDDLYSIGQSNILPGAYCLIQISDTGIGMIESVKTRIFEPFFTTKGVGKGTGLGLSVSYGIVKNHGGYIDAYSEPGKGSTFKVYLPCAEPGAEDAIKMFGSEAIQTGTETVLMVDDESGVLESAGRILNLAGYTVLLADSGKKAVQLYEEHGGDIALVVLDMIMPDMDGRDVYHAIKRMDPDVRVVLSSGYSINGQAGKLMAEGIQGFIQKPFSIVDFCDTVRNVIDGKQPSGNNGLFPPQS